MPPDPPRSLALCAGGSTLHVFRSILFPSSKYSKQPIGILIQLFEGRLVWSCLWGHPPQIQVPIPQWGTADAGNKDPLVGAQCHQRFPLYYPGVGQNISLHAAAAADRTSTYLVSAFPIHSASFVTRTSPILSGGMCPEQCVRVLIVLATRVVSRWYDLSWLTGRKISSVYLSQVPRGSISFRRRQSQGCRSGKFTKEILGGGIGGWFIFAWVDYILCLSRPFDDQSCLYWWKGCRCSVGTLATASIFSSTLYVSVQILL